MRRGQFAQQERVAHGEFGVDVRSHARGKFGSSGGVERNGQNAAQQTAVEGGDPLGAVFSPEQDAVALDDTVLGQKRSEAAGEARQIAVCGDVTPVAVIMHHGDLAVETAKVVDQCGEVVAHCNGKSFRSWQEL